MTSTSKFLKNYTIKVSDVPAYVDFNSEWTIQLDRELCRLILESDDLRLTPEMKDHFKKTYDLINPANNKLKVLYRPRNNLGRRYPEEPSDEFYTVNDTQRRNPTYGKYWGNLTIHSKYIKNTIFHYLGWLDFDQRKGHPTILYEVAKKNGLRLGSYEDYIKDGGFEMICNEMIAWYSVDDEYPLTKSDIKDLFNKTIYGGGHAKWCDHITHANISDLDRQRLERKGKNPKEMRNKHNPHQFYKRFARDTEMITKIICDANTELRQKICDGMPDDTHLPFSKCRNKLMSQFCGILEHEITFRAYKYRVDNGLCPAKMVDWGYDGFTTPPPPAYTDHAFHLNSMNEYVREKTGFSGITFVEKQMDPGTIIQSVIDIRRQLMDATAVPIIELEVVVNNESSVNVVAIATNEDQEYIGWKAKFEQEWCKLKNTATFLRRYYENGIFNKFVFQDKKKLIISYENESYVKTMDNGKVRKIKYITEWLEDPTQLVFEDAGVFPPPLQPPPNVFNLWTSSPYEDQPFTCMDDPEIDREAVDLFVSHIDIMCGKDADQTNWVCSWFAHSIQKPSEKPEHALNFIGKQGIGKSVILNTFSNLYGAGKTLETQTPERDVWGSFNSTMTNAYMVVLSETDKRNAFGADGKIKALITDYPMWINPKGKDQFRINSYHRVVQLTNTADPTKTSLDDRRNYILRCSDELKGNDQYFIDLNKALSRPNALRSIYWSFKIMDISGWNFRRVPRTKYHSTIIEHTKNPLNLFLEAFTLNRMGMTECIMTGNELLTEFKIWREGTGYKFDDHMNEGVLLKKIKTECELPDDTFQRGNRTKNGFKQTVNISMLKQHFKLGYLLLSNGEFIEQDALVNAGDHEVEYEEMEE